MRFPYRSVLASVLIVALLASTTAYLTHKHPLASTGQTDPGHCGLCLQFDRVAGAPATVALVVDTLWLVAAAVPHPVSPRIVRPGARLPEARAPPGLLPPV